METNKLLQADYLDIIFDNRNGNGPINANTLGLKLERPEQIDYEKNHTGLAPFNIKSFAGYMAALYNLTMEQLNKNVSFEDEKKHSIYISTSNLSPRVRHITREQRQLLFQNGEQAAREFFAPKR